MKSILKPSTLLFLSVLCLFSFKLANSESDPVLTILGKTHEEATVTLSELAQFEKIDLNDAFKEKGYIVDSYFMVYLEDGLIVELTGSSENFSEEMKTAFSSFGPGQRFSFEKINVKAPTGMPLKMPSFSFEVVD